jgi:hypothetical protein
VPQGKRGIRTQQSDPHLRGTGLPEPDFRDQLYPPNTRASLFICIYACLNAVKRPWRYGIMWLLLCREFQIQWAWNRPWRSR